MKKQTLTPRKLALKKIAIAYLSDNRTGKNNAADGFRSTVPPTVLTIICTTSLAESCPYPTCF
jgi:hypothetical protein